MYISADEISVIYICYIGLRIQNASSLFAGLGRKGGKRNKSGGVGCTKILADTVGRMRYIPKVQHQSLLGSAVFGCMQTLPFHALCSKQVFHIFFQYCYQYFMVR